MAPRKPEGGQGEKGGLGWADPGSAALPAAPGEEAKLKKE
jgi:hypothetical protein